MTYPLTRTHCDLFHHQVGDFSSEVMRSIGALSPTSKATSASGGSVIVVGGQQQQRPQQQQPQQPREPDSGISSARSTGTVPWSHNEAGLPALQALRPADQGGQEEAEMQEHEL